MQKLRTCKFYQNIYFYRSIRIYYFYKNLNNEIDILMLHQNRYLI
jgi:hypothetical protein